MIALCIQDRVGRDQPGLNRRKNAFAALRVRESRRIADQQQAVIDQTTRRSAIQQIRMAAERRRVLGDSASRFQKRHERGDMIVQSVRVHPAETDVEIVLLAKTPAVALKVGAKVKLGSV